MTPNDYIEKAKHAMLTDQPNLAMLYMKRGTQILEQRRRAHLKTTVEGSLILLSEDINEMGRVMYEQIAPAFRHITQAFEQFHFELLQENYALVSE